MQTVQQALTKEQLIFQVLRHGPRHQMCWTGEGSVETVEMVGTYIEGQAGEVDGGAEGEEGSEEGREEEVAAGPEREE